MFWLLASKWETTSKWKIKMYQNVMFVFHLQDMFEGKLGTVIVPLIMYTTHQTLPQQVLEILFEFFFQICFKLNHKCHTSEVTLTTQLRIIRPIFVKTFGFLKLLICNLHGMQINQNANKKENVFLFQYEILQFPNMLCKQPHNREHYFLLPL